MKKGEILKRDKLCKCINCGRQFYAKLISAKYCSQQCKNQYINMGEKAHGELTKTCHVCGKEFKTYKSRKNTCSDECSKKLKCKTRNQLEHEKCLLVNREKAINSTPKGFSFIECYLSKNAYRAKYLCEACGEITDVGVGKDSVECKHCNEINKKQKEHKRKLDNKIKIQDKSIQMKAKICKKCGAIFYSECQDKEYCSKTCQRSASRKRREERYGRRSKVHERFSLDKIIDDDISLKKLYEKDNGYCWICGEKCNYDDFEIVNGATICGDMYPSIDHVIPRAKGGCHSWDNVKLAHRRCNYLKKDKIITEAS